MKLVPDVNSAAHCLLIPSFTCTLVNYPNLLNFVDVDDTTGLRVRLKIVLIVISRGGLKKILDVKHIRVLMIHSFIQTLIVWVFVPFNG